MIYVEIYQVMWNAFAGILAALTLVAIIGPLVLIVCEFIQHEEKKVEKASNRSANTAAIPPGSAESSAEEETPVAAQEN